MSFINNLKYLFNDYEWICAYRKTDIQPQQIKGMQKGYTLMKIPKGYWAADPFIYRDGELVYAFFEYTSIKRKKSVLAMKKIAPEEEDEIHIIYEFQGHTSYPCIFEWQGKRYIIPETKSAKSIVLLECVTWPFEWKLKAVLKNDILAMDCTPFVKNKELFLLVYEENKNDIWISIGKLDVEKGTLSELRRLKKYNEKIARPGGKMIYLKNEMIRVRQSGICFYGEKIQFVRTEIDLERNEIKEDIINEFLPSQVGINYDRKIIGLHTYNICNGYEIIDLFTQKINLLKPVLYVLHRLRILGYGEDEKDGRFIWEKQKE